MKKAVIVATPDVFANGVKPRALVAHLEEKGFSVELLSSAQDLRTRFTVFGKSLPMVKPFPRALWVISLRLIARVIPMSKMSVVLQSLARESHNKSCALITHHRLSTIAPDLVICESSADIGFVSLPRVASLQMLDLPCPWAEELYYGGQLTKRGFNRMKRLESNIYRQADTLSFHWHTYSSFVKATKYDGDNIIDMGYGTNEKSAIAEYNDDPRVIFLGLLDGYWVNLKLLKDIVGLSSKVDVYGGPKPPDNIAINYKGYAPTLDVMAKYQFGLITISDDELRKNSFSSKHLEYISYGLPVFTPGWRRDDKLDSSSIYYESAEDFIDKLNKYSNRDEWYKKHKQALSAAKRFSWDSAFVELDKALVEFKVIGKKG